MSEDMSAEKRLAVEYPSLYHFLETTLWPRVDSDNLLEMLHRVMRHWHPDFVSRLVSDVERLATDNSFGPPELTEFFNRDVDARYQIIDSQNCRPLLNTLAGYLRYLYSEERVTGTPL